MRMQPIEHPKSVAMRLAYVYSRRRLGKVITPLKVINARVPKSLSLARAMSAFGSSADLLGESTRELVLSRVAMLNDCAFCVDIARMRNLDNAAFLEKLAKLDDYEQSPVFTEAERAALAYADELNRTRRVSDATFARARQSLSEEQVVELTLLCAVENFYNMVNHALEIPSDDLCALRAPAKRGKRASTAA